MNEVKFIFYIYALITSISNKLNYIYRVKFALKILSNKELVLTFCDRIILTKLFGYIIKIYY